MLVGTKVSESNIHVATFPITLKSLSSCGMVFEILQEEDGPPVHIIFKYGGSQFYTI